MNAFLLGLLSLIFTLVSAAQRGGRFPKDSDFQRLKDVKLQTKCERYSATHQKWIEDDSMEEGKLYRERVKKSSTVTWFKFKRGEHSHKWRGSKMVEVAAAMLFWDVPGAEELTAFMIAEYGLDAAAIQSKLAEMNAVGIDDDADLVSLLQSELQ